MDRVFIDEETGEDLIHPLLDCDIHGPIDSTVNNAETGEPEVNLVQQHISRSYLQIRKIPFQVLKPDTTEVSELRQIKQSSMYDTIIIPRQNLPQIPREVKENLSQRKKSSKKRHLRELEEVPDAAPFGQINPICLFLPAIIYFRWFLALLMLFEVILHMWAHHKNKALKNAGVYFRSPFHDICAEFCALCRNENCMNRIGKMQQIRMHKFLRQCNYMKRVVT